MYFVTQPEDMLKFNKFHCTYAYKHYSYKKEYRKTLVYKEDQNARVYQKSSIYQMLQPQ